MLSFQKNISTILIACLLSINTLSIFLCSPSAEAREISKAGQIFNNTKNAVVTISSGYTHGSGVLIDKRGFILTNNHVVRENKDHLRVRFKRGMVVKAIPVAQDRAHDLAILWVNLENITDTKVIDIFKPANNDELVLVGEKVIAIGSPVNKDVYEKNLTAGIISKYDKNVIHHDVTINGGNSGGPLLNYDGQLVGINTFAQSDRGKAIGGAVPVTFIPALVSKAESLIGTDKVVMPSSEILPDTPVIAYPTHQLLKNNPEFFTIKRKQKDYIFDSRYFTFLVTTPAQGYAQALKTEQRVLKRRKKRAKKKGFKISDDELETKNKTYYDPNNPVVTIYTVPNPKLTTGSKVVNTVSFIGALGLTAVTFGVGDLH